MTTYELVLQRDFNTTFGLRPVLGPSKVGQCARVLMES